MGLGGYELSFGAFYVKYAPLVRRSLAWRGVREDDLDDVVQETFITLQRLLPTFEGRSSIETWLYSVTWRVAATHQRQRKRRERPSDVPERFLADAPAKSSPDRSFHATLGQLDEQHRDLIALHEVAELSISQLSQLTGSARATVRDRLDRGRKALSTRLEHPPTRGQQPAWLDELAPRSAARLAKLAKLAQPNVQHVVCDGNAISTVDDTVVALWRGRSTVASLEALFAMMFGLIEDHPDGIRYLSVIEPTATPPEREARQLTAWGLGKVGHQLHVAGWAVEDLRMKPEVAALLNACLFIGGVPINIRVFDEVAPAARWLYAKGPEQWQQLCARVEDLRAQLTLVR